MPSSTKIFPAHVVLRLDQMLELCMSLTGTNHPHRYRIYCTVMENSSATELQLRQSTSISSLCCVIGDYILKIACLHKLLPDIFTLWTSYIEIKVSRTRPKSISHVEVSVLVAQMKRFQVSCDDAFRFLQLRWCSVKQFVTFQNHTQSQQGAAYHQGHC